MQHIIKNDMDIIINDRKNTPRTCVCFYFAIDEEEKFSGMHGLFSRLLLQGTKTRNAQTLAKELENNCIDVSIKTKQDYIKVSFLFLNEDFNLAMDYARDILLNSTFEDLEKEKFKMKGEIKSDLDNPRVLASDKFIKRLFDGHYYSNTASKTLEELDKISTKDIMDTHKKILNSRKVLSIAGDIKNTQEFVEYFVKNFDFMKSHKSCSKIQTYDTFKPKEGNLEIIRIPKNDLNQAQIFRGFIVPSIQSEFYTKISVMNNILGSSGLSSRLFVELRDRQGLAYTVRSGYETLYKSAVFSFYIATEPKNIKKSLDGFNEQLEKLANINPTDEELKGAKENITGKLEYFSQTNSQLASIEGYNYLMGLGLNYSDKFLEMINSVTKQDVSDAARLILQKESLVCALAPEKFFNF